MRVRFSIFLFSVLGSAVAGYFVGKWRPEIVSSRVGEKPGQPQVPVTVGSQTNQNTEAVSAEEAAFRDLRRQAAAMSDVEFGARYAQLMAAANSAETTQARAALLSAVDGPKALAAYLAFKKQQGLPLSADNLTIREMLTIAGQKDGARAMDLFLASAPEFCEISSLMHGWALQDPIAAAAWFNNLPDNFSRQHGCLSGLVYGIALKDPQVAREVFSKLSPADQLDSADSITRALFLEHGCAAVDLIRSGLNGDLKYKCLHGILDRMEKRPSAETVPWLAGQVSESPEAAAALAGAWKRWATGDPEAASAWRTSAVSANPQLEQILPSQKP